MRFRNKIRPQASKIAKCLKDSLTMSLILPVSTQQWLTTSSVVEISFQTTKSTSRKNAKSRTTPTMYPKLTNLTSTKYSSLTINK